MIIRKDSNIGRILRHKRVRGKISGTAARPRLCVYRSNSNIYAQVIDDVSGKTLASASTVERDFTEYGGNKAAARKVAILLQSVPLRRALRRLYSTAAVISTTAEYRSLQTAPAKADSNSKGGYSDG